MVHHSPDILSLLLISRLLEVKKRLSLMVGSEAMLDEGRDALTDVA
jgi:hypothetical protein